MNIQLLVWAALLLFTAVTGLWCLSLRLKDTSIIDIFWGFGFLLVGTLYFAAQQGWQPRQLLVWLLIVTWALRLSIHIARRNHGKPEDSRYAAWRQQYGHRWWWWSYIQVFLLQGGLIWLLASPVWVIQTSPPPAFWTFWDGLGLLLWVVGFAFEALGDWQLARYKAQPHPAGSVLQTGLWRYTRHPNYFGESVLWWGYGCFALACGAWWALFAPALMTFLLLRVSGVAMLEKSLQLRPAYRRYIAQTPSFFPWFPKKDV
jgi:steroid 5-alpha reductase family enzyme